MGDLTVEERMLLAWYAALNDEERAMIDTWTQTRFTAACDSRPMCAPSPSVLHLLRRDLEQLLKIAASEGRD